MRRARSMALRLSSIWVRVHTLLINYLRPSSNVLSMVAGVLDNVLVFVKEFSKESIVVVEEVKGVFEVVVLIRLFLLQVVCYFQFSLYPVKFI
jgi:hypothetical protein